MKQVVQHLGTGALEVAESPCPRLGDGELLIMTRASLISSGTERMLLDFGRAGLLSKARQQPDRVRQTLHKVRSDGLLETIDAVRAKLDTTIPLGYCNAGVVLEVGSGVDGFALGDRVISSGFHAEIVRVPKNLCAKIPDGVSDEAAAFAALGAIALQGIRLAAPTLGESFAVFGLGLVGMLAAQILQANGCRVMGIDLNRDRIALAQHFGVETVCAPGDPVAAAIQFTQGRGMDGVIVAAASSSNEPIRQSARMCRQRGRIVLVGVTGLELSRSEFYEKELSFQVSCSYGPGRNDSNYETGGHDYPFGFVRWTEQRNLQAVLQMLADAKLDAVPLISHRFPIARAAEAYDLIARRQPSLGVLLEYPHDGHDSAFCAPTIRVAAPRTVGRIAAKPVIAFIGPGSFASAVLIPAARSLGATLKVAASSSGLSASLAARKFGFELATSDAAAAIRDPDVNLVMIASRHDSHARLVCEALEAGKHVFVEKPLALNEKELAQVESAYSAAGAKAMLMVGFNRRFAPQSRRLCELAAETRQAKAMVITINAGEVAADHWSQSALVGGGRIIGEACHFIDLARFVIGHSISRVSAAAMRDASRRSSPDTVSFALSFTDGSIATVHYLANGNRGFARERIELFCGGRIAQLDNFRAMRGYGWPGFRSLNLWRQDKGHRGEVSALLEAVERGGDSPIAFGELLEVTRASFEVNAHACHGSFASG